MIYVKKKTCESEDGVVPLPPPPPLPPLPPLPMNIRPLDISPSTDNYSSSKNRCTSPLVIIIHFTCLSVSMTH